jgi:hypothetical protein
MIRLAAFAAALAVVFGLAALAGGAVDPDRGAKKPEHAQDDAAPHPVRGLAVAEHGLRLVVDDTELRRGATERLRFRIVDERGATVRDFDVEHTKRMHVIVARRDLDVFEHVHPEQARDGSWSVPITLREAGSYRLFADFSRDGEPVTLATDLTVAGAPSPATIDDGGYDVRLDAGRVRPGEEATLRFTVTKDGRRVQTEPYLGAGGHLVALREGDLAFLHVHPTTQDGIAFEATFPTAGRYRLFLQFQHHGRVQTAAFTQEVA